MKLEKFKEEKKKKKSIIVFTICCILLIAGVFLYQSFALFETRENFNFLEGNVEDPGDLYFAYYVDNQITLNVPTKESNYTLSSKSNCTNGVTVSWNDETWSAILNYSNYQKENNSRVKCNLYFEDKYKNLMIPMEYEESENGSGSTGYLRNKTYLGKSEYHFYLTKVVYQSEITPIENVVEVVDFSVAQDGSVKGYYVREDPSNIYSKVTLYIQADGKIKVNPKASYYALINSECTASGCMAYGITNTGLVEGKENWDLSLVTDMSYMFAWSLDKEFDFTKYNISNVTNTSHMFYYSSISNLNISNLDTSKVTNMSSMFSSMKSLTNLDLSNFDTSNVTNMSDMFYRTSNLTNIIYGDKFIHKEDADITDMFRNCPANKPTHSSWNSVTW